MPGLEMGDARGDPDPRGGLADRACDHPEILGPPSLAEPYGVQIETLGGLRLVDDDRGVGDASGEHVSAERYAAELFAVHPAILTVVFSSAKGDDGLHIFARPIR